VWKGRTDPFSRALPGRSLAEHGCREVGFFAVCIFKTIGVHVTSSAADNRDVLSISKTEVSIGFTIAATNWTIFF